MQHKITPLAIKSRNVAMWIPLVKSDSHQTLCPIIRFNCHSNILFGMHGYWAIQLQHFAFVIGTLCIIYFHFVRIHFVRHISGTDYSYKVRDCCIQHIQHIGEAILHSPTLTCRINIGIRLFFGGQISMGYGLIWQDTIIIFFQFSLKVETKVINNWIFLWNQLKNSFGYDF